MGSVGHRSCGIGAPSSTRKLNYRMFMDVAFSSITLAFLAAVLVLLLIPGPAVLYIVSRSVAQGRIAGVVSACGVAVGSMFHVIAAALGLSAVLVSSAQAFQVVRWAGAAYLVYLGWRTIRSADKSETLEARSEPLGAVFRQGVVVNALNPKVAVFFFAFLPQFVHPDAGQVSAQFAVLGVTLVLVGILTDAGYAMVAGSVSTWLKTKRSLLRKTSGSILMFLGIAAARS